VAARLPCPLTVALPAALFVPAAAAAKCDVDGKLFVPTHPSHRISYRHCMVKRHINKDRENMYEVVVSVLHSPSLHLVMRKKKLASIIFFCRYKIFVGHRKTHCVCVCTRLHSTGAYGRAIEKRAWRKER
jgi:hypothetical protein